MVVVGVGAVCVVVEDAPAECFGVVDECFSVGVLDSDLSVGSRDGCGGGLRDGSIVALGYVVELEFAVKDARILRCPFGWFIGGVAVVVGFPPLGGRGAHCWWPAGSRSVPWGSRM